MKRSPYVVGALTGLVCLGLACVNLRTGAPDVVYNASASVPIGYYRVTPVDHLDVHDLVLVRTPDTVRDLADQRQYLPKAVPMIKGIAALGGDEVCAVGVSIFINGRLAATRQTHDRAARPMPSWNGCHRLLTGEVFLLNAGAPYSFDGRYFGVVDAHLVLGKVHRL